MYKFLTSILIFISIGITIPGCLADSSPRPADSILSPVVDPEYCGRQSSTAEGHSWICSPDEILSEQVMGWFDVYVTDLKKKSENTTCGDGKAGYELATAWIKKMALNLGESKESGAKRYAKTLHDNWGVGDSRCNNGVLMFVAIEDRQMHISIGKGANGVFSDSDADDVISSMKSYLKNNDFDGALKEGTEGIGDHLLVHEGLSAGAVVGIVFGSIAGAICLIVTGVGIYSCYKDNNSTSNSNSTYNSSSSAGYTTRQKKYSVRNTDKTKQKKDFVKKLRAAEMEHKNTVNKKGKYNQETCPICLELFKDLKKDAEYDQDVLACGHEFCHDCIEKWYKRKKEEPNNIGVSDSDLENGTNYRLCPICRQPDYPEESSASQSDGESKVKKVTQSVPVYRSTKNWVDRDAEFRMNSLAYMFPLWLTMNSANSWCCRDGFGSCYPRGYTYACDPFVPRITTTSTSTYRPSSTSTYRPSTSTSTYGSSRKFGGGSSYGGGGSGSSWSSSSHTTSSFGGGFGGGSSFGGGGSFGGGSSFGGGGGGGGW